MYNTKNTLTFLTALNISRKHYATNIILSSPSPVRFGIQQTNFALNGNYKHKFMLAAAYAEQQQLLAPEIIIIRVASSGCRGRKLMRDGINRGELLSQ